VGRLKLIVAVFGVFAVAGCDVIGTAQISGVKKTDKEPSTPEPLAPIEVQITNESAINGVHWSWTCSRPCESRSAVRRSDLATVALGGDFAEGLKSQSFEIQKLEDNGDYRLTVEAKDLGGTAVTSVTNVQSVRLTRMPRSNHELTKVNLLNLQSVATQGALEYLRSHFFALAPETFVESDREIFASYVPYGLSVRANNYLRDLPLTGVGWDALMDGTLITTQHVVMAAHYPRGIGNTINFADSTGNVVIRTVADSRNIGSDILVIKLNAPVPDNVPVYPVFDPAVADASAIHAAPYLMTDQTRKVFVHRVAAANGPLAYGTTYPGLPTFMSKYLVVGDSGNPSFVLVEGVPVLVSTATSASYGSGPNYGYATHQGFIEAAIEQMGYAP
jgi:hypothetical protein